MFKILFVCTGNICRSPMAEAVMRHKIEQVGLSEQISVDSAGTLSWHAGEAADPRTLTVLDAKGIKHPSIAREVTTADIENYDLVLGMGEDHITHLKNIVPEKYHDRIKLFLSYAPELNLNEVPDPYRAGGFENVYQMIDVASTNLLNQLKDQIN